MLKDFSLISPNNYMFAALRGIQAGREYYVISCPLKLVPKIFLFDEEEVPPDLRAQRILNKARVPKIAEYLVKNRNDYILSSLTASVDAKVKFIPVNLEWSATVRDSIKLGFLVIPMDARIILNDGQHRRAAIERALKECPELGDDTVSVVLYVDAGLKRSQQMFADLNRYSVRPSQSLSLLYDHRSAMAKAVKKVMNDVSIFKNKIELEKTSISNRSQNLFTLSSLYQSLKSFWGKKDADIVDDKEIRLAIEYWETVTENIIEWQLILNGDLVPSAARKEYVHVHGVVLQALGKLGHYLVNEHPSDWKEMLKKLQDVDWRRKNKEAWEGRLMQGGRMSKTQMSLTLTTNYLKLHLGLPLTEKEKEREELFARKTKEV